MSMQLPLIPNMTTLYTVCAHQPDSVTPMNLPDASFNFEQHHAYVECKLDVTGSEITVISAPAAVRIMEPLLKKNIIIVLSRINPQWMGGWMD